MKREKAAVASVPQEQAPKAEVTPAPTIVAPEPKPSEPLKTVPVEASKETQVPLETVEPTAAEAPVHIEGGALSLEQLEEKGFEARAETLSPEEELLKGEQESEQERKYSALAKNLERPSLRDAFKADMLKAVKADGGDVEKADQAIDMMPLDKMLTAPWKKHTRGVIERYAQAAQPSTVKRTIEITPTQNLSETSKQWLSAIDALEDHFVHSGEYDAIRRAVPSHFTPEQKLERYVTALQKYIEWDEDQDPKALKRAVALASRDPEKGAVTISHEPLDSLVLYKKAQREGYNVSFTHSSPLYPASWIIGDGVNQIQIEVGTWDSHVAIANKLEAKGDFEKYGHLSGAARTAALKKYNQVMENWLDKGAIRKASNNAFQIRRLDDPKNLNKVWDLFKRNLHALRNYNDPAHFQEDPALFIESLRNLQGASTSDMEVPLTYTYIQDRFGGDIVKAVYTNLGLYSEDQDRYLHSGPPIKEAIDYIKNTPVATRIKHALNFVVNWATAELNGGRVPSTFLRSQYYKKLSHAELRETLGPLDRASAILQNQLDTYREWWNDLPLETRQEKFWDFMDAVETGKQLTDPHLQEMADLGRALEDDRFNQLSVLGKAPHYIENYWHHLWENPKKATRFVSDWVRGKHPLQGSVKFKRTRIHPLYSDGRAAGLVPKSYNPIEVLLQSLNMKDRYIHMNRLANWLKEQGLMKFARDPRKLPPLEIGWGHIDDPMMEPKFRTKEGLVTPGKWYVPKPFADIVNNYLHPGWDNHLAYRGARAYINRINMTTLGLSAFHIMTTAYNSMAIDGAYGLQSLLDAAKYRDPNRLKLATLAFIRGMVPGASLIDNMLKGAHVYDTWLHPEQAKAIHEQITQVGVKANLPFKWERYYFQDDTAKFWQAWHDASLKHPWSYSKVAWHGLFAPFEALSKPIFNYIVPLGKLGALAKLAERELYLESKQDPRLVNPESKMLRGTAIADRLDDAFGEVEYDNFRMSWWAKSLAKLGFKSAGWSLGTGRLGEHAFSDFVKEPFRAASGYGFEVPLATGYFMALAVGMAMYNTLLQLWLTSGKGKPEFPSSLKDLMYPKDGEGGRVYPKTYITDIISFA
ncbi:MAG: hypothetical protein KGI27_13630, partial [Thaumarchaeota archaeon]|nr:hypothetical protein [Nitrososphaerota archaeon]